MAYTLADAQSFLGVLNAKGANFPNTPQMQVALLAWMRQENGPNYNPLNIMGHGGVANFGSFTGSANATANLLLGSSNYSGVVAAGRTGDPRNFLSAIAQSPWDAAHYGAPGTNHLISVYNSLAGDLRNVQPLGSANTGASPGSPSGGGGGLNINLDPFSGVSKQIGDTFTWLGFILVGIVLLIGGIILMKPNTIEQVGKAGAVAAL